MEKKDARYKSSFYNLFIPWNKGNEIIVFNALNGALVSLSNDEAKYLRASGISSINQQDRETLIALGILVKEGVDEKEIAKEEIRKSKYDQSFLQFAIALTYNCNLNCSYCYESRSKESVSNAAIDKIITFIKKQILSAKSKGFCVVLYGGEPLLYPQKCYIILQQLKQWAKEEGVFFQYTISTNATLLSKEILTELKKYNLGAIHLTLDGPKRIHDQRRKYKDGKGTYDDIIKAIKMLEEEGVHTNVRINIDKDNVGYMDELFNELCYLGFGTFKHTEIYFDPIVPWPKRVREGVKEARKSLVALYDSVKTLKKNAEEYSLPTHRTEVRTRAPRGSCPPCMARTSHNYAIGPSGDVYRCVFLLGCPEHSIGNIKDDGSLERTPIYDALLKEDVLESTKCTNCKLLPLCQGGCVAGAYSFYGTYSKPFCNITKKSIEGKVLQQVEYLTHKNGGKENGK